MKKFLLSMLTLLGATSVWAQSVSVPDTRVAQQRTNVLKVTLSSASDTRDLQFDLTLPEGISLVENAGTVLDAAAGHVIQYQAQADGSIRFVVVDAIVDYDDPDATSADAATYGKKFSEGVLVEIPVLAAADFDGNPAVAQVTNLYISNDAGQNVSADPANFEFNIIMNLLGDVNEDGAVDVQDIVCVIGDIQQETPTVFNRGAADIDNEGNIDVQDVVGIVDIIQTKTPSSSAKEFVDEEVGPDPE